MSSSSSSSFVAAASTAARVASRGKAMRFRHGERAKRMNRITSNFRLSAFGNMCDTLLHPVTSITKSRTRKTRIRKVQPSVTKGAKIALSVIADTLTRSIVERMLFLTHYKRRSTAQVCDLEFILERDFNVTFYNHGYV